MAGYRELREGWQYQRTDVGVSATRVFIEDAAAAGSLPAIGAAHPDNAACIVRSRASEYYHTAAGVLKKKVTVSYNSTKSTTAAYRPDTRLWRVEAGGEQIIVPNSSTKWVWDGTTDPVVSQAIALDIGRGSFTATKTFTSSQLFAEWYMASYIDNAGKINPAIYQGFRVGSLMVGGLSAGNQFDGDGNELVTADIVFLYRFIPDNNVTLDDWNFVYDNSGGTAHWGRPMIRGASPKRFLYEYGADFETIVVAS